MCNKPQLGETVKVIKGRATGVVGIIVSIKERQELPFLVRFNNGGSPVGYTAKELRRV